MKWSYTLIQICRALCLIVLLGHTAACVNLTKLRGLLNTVSYEDTVITYALVDDLTTMRFAVGDTNGRFQVFSARLGFHQKDITSGQLDVTVATGSIDMNNPLFEGVLRGRAWFNSDLYPLANFQARSLTITRDNQLQAQGHLTIKEVTQPLVMLVSLPDGLPDLTTPPATVPFEARGSFSRASFGMTALPDLAGDEVTLTVTGLFDLHPTAD